MKSILAILALCVASSRGMGPDPVWKEGCGCCWPLPEDCCPVTTVTPTEPPTPTPTAPTPPCPCEADIAIVLDRTGSVEDTEFTNVLNWVNSLIMTNDDGDNNTDCFGYAVTPFATKAPILFDFNHAASTNVAMATSEISGIPAPKGDTKISKGINQARIMFGSDLNPRGAPVCRAVLLVTDGGSDDKTTSPNMAANLAAQDPTIRMCIVRMKDPKENAAQQAQRIDELQMIIGASNPGSTIIDEAGTEFGINQVPDMAAVMDCLCCSETTTAPPPPCPDQPTADIVFIIDRTGSIIDAELDNVKTFIKNFIDDIVPSRVCSRTAVVSYSGVGTIEYDFQDDEAIDGDKAKDVINDIIAPTGDTDTAKGFLNANIVFDNRLPLSIPAQCKVAVWISDGGTDNKDALYAQAANLQNDHDPRLCIVEMQDTGATPAQIANRMLEFNTVLATPFGYDSEIATSHDFALSVPALAGLQGCVFKACAGQPQP